MARAVATLPDRPNVLRLWLGEELPASRNAVLLIETNIDDMTAELLGYVQERLFAAGAADVWFTPIFMKKNRPATMLSLLCAREREEAVVRMLLEETSTLGVRVREVRRHEAQRETFEFESSLGPASVKVKRLPGKKTAALAGVRGVPPAGAGAQPPSRRGLPHRRSRGAREARIAGGRAAQAGKGKGTPFRTSPCRCFDSRLSGFYCDP